MFLCNYIVLKASSFVTFSVIFAARAIIFCIDSGTRDTICISLELSLPFFDILINAVQAKKTLPEQMMAQITNTYMSKWVDSFWPHEKLYGFSLKILFHHEKDKIKYLWFWFQWPQRSQYRLWCMRSRSPIEETTISRRRHHGRWEISSFLMLRTLLG